MTLVSEPSSRPVLAAWDIVWINEISRALGENTDRYVAPGWGPLTPLRELSWEFANLLAEDFVKGSGRSEPTRFF